MKKQLSKKGIKILADLCKAKRALPIRRISERTGVSWKTTNDNIKQMEKRGIVKCVRSKRRTYCKVNPKVIDKCKRV